MNQRGVLFQSVQQPPHITIHITFCQVFAEALCHLVAQNGNFVHSTEFIVLLVVKLISCLDKMYFNLSLLQSTATSILKKSKRARRGNVTFDQVTVFFFPRCQGFTSVPSRGGCTLGMMQRHSVLRTYTLAEFAVEQQLLRREKLLNRLREEKLEALKLKVSKFAQMCAGSGSVNILVTLMPTSATQQHI